MRQVWPGSGLTGTSWVAWVIASALVLRGIAWFQYDPVTFDSAGYFEIAALIQGGRWFEALAHDYPPLYALLIAGLQYVVGTAEGAGLLIAFVADLLILIPIVALARRAVGDEAAWAAAFLWVVHPSSIRLGVQALSDAPTALCVAAAVYAGLLAMEQGRVRCAVAAGMASGLGYLFRPEGLEPAVALAVFYAFVAHGAEGKALSAQRAVDSGQPSTLGASRFALRVVVRRVGWILAPLAGWAIVAAPYVAHISVEAGALTLSKKKSATSFVRAVAPGFERGAPSGTTGQSGTRAVGRLRDTGVPQCPSAQVPECPRGAQVSSSASEVERKTVRATDEGWLRGVGQTVYVFQKPLVNGLSPLLVFLTLVGIVGVLRRRVEGWNRAHVLLAGLFLLHLGILIGLTADKGATYLGRHHFLLMVVYALPLAGAGLVWVLAWLRDRLRGRRWVPATAMGLIVAATAIAILTRGPDQGRSTRTAAAWIRSQVVGTPIIVTSLAKLTYHAHAERVDIRGSYDEILRRARERSAQFVALYPDLIHQTSPDFLAHLPSSDLELVKVFPEPTPRAPDQRLELYRLRAPNRSP